MIVTSKALVLDKCGCQCCCRYRNHHHFIPIPHLPEKLPEPKWYKQVLRSYADLEFLQPHVRPEGRVSLGFIPLPVKHFIKVPVVLPRSDDEDLEAMRRQQSGWASCEQQLA